MKVILKKGREKALKNRHHWIFSGAILHAPSFTDGLLLPVFSEEGEQLGTAYFNRQAKIIGRLVAFGDADPLEAIAQNIRNAAKLCQSLINPIETNAFRLINGEGDFLPGLIVDQYDKTLVVQITTLGMERLKNYVVEILSDFVNPIAIYEKSNVPSRKEEGLNEMEGWLKGQQPDEIQIKENNLDYWVSLVHGQKTGFFLDHREMRRLVRNLSKGKRVLNCFSYTGGFTVAAMAGKAVQADSVDISEKAIALAKRNCDLNPNPDCTTHFFVQDVFQFLRKEEQLDYEIVILDPPAFAKRKKDVIPACRGYKDINRITMQKMPSGSLLLSCSCSYYVDEALFQKVLFQAAVEAGRNVRIIGRHYLALDHPINLCHPESDYLKSFLLFIE